MDLVSLEQFETKIIVIYEGNQELELLLTWYFKVPGGSSAGFVAM